MNFIFFTPMWSLISINVSFYNLLWFYSKIWNNLVITSNLHMVLAAKNSNECIRNIYEGTELNNIISSDELLLIYQFNVFLQRNIFNKKEFIDCISENVKDKSEFKLISLFEQQFIQAKVFLKRNKMLECSFTEIEKIVNSFESILNEIENSKKYDKNQKIFILNHSPLCNILISYIITVNFYKNYNNIQIETKNNDKIYCHVIYYKYKNDFTLLSFLADESQRLSKYNINIFNLQVVVSLYQIILFILVDNNFLFRESFTILEKIFNFNNNAQLFKILQCSDKINDIKILIKQDSFLLKSIILENFNIPTQVIVSYLVIIDIFVDQIILYYDKFTNCLKSFKRFKYSMKTFYSEVKKIEKINWNKYVQRFINKDEYQIENISFVEKHINRALKSYSKDLTRDTIYIFKSFL